MGLRGDGEGLKHLSQVTVVVPATAFLLAITLIGRNLTRLHAWHTVRGVEEPWQTHLGELIDDRPIDRMTRTRGTRRPRQD